MDKVNVYFKFTWNQFINVKEICFEAKDIFLKEYNKLDDYSYDGKIQGLLVKDDLEVLVNCRGQRGFDWELEIKTDQGPLTKKPIKGTINSKGTSIHYESYKLP